MGNRGEAIEEMEHREVRTASGSVYREFSPSPELRDYVRALAWFGPADEAIGPRAPVREFHLGDDVGLTPSFADTHHCLLFSIGASYDGSGWHSCRPSPPTVMGAMSRATIPPGAERSGMIGVYLRPRGTAALLGLPATELTDRVISLSDIWKRFVIAPEQTNLHMVETVLTERLAAASVGERALRIAELASHVGRCGGQVSVAHMAELTGLSRQHLARLFLHYLGVTPKLYARLVRFRASLSRFGNQRDVRNWSGLAAHLGYADQSHFIAECREFTSFTPQQLARGDRFHPFLGDASG